MRRSAECGWGAALGLTLVLGALSVTAGETQSLTAKLADADETARVAAAQELGRRREVAAIPALVNALQDRFAIVQDAAADALTAIGAPAAPVLRKEIGSTNIAIRAGAAVVLSAVPDPANAEALCAALRDEVWAVREPAIEGVVRLGPPVLDKLLGLAAEPQGRGAESALRVIARWGPAAKAAAPVVLPQLANTADLRIRLVAAYALAQIGPEVGVSLPRLQELWSTLPGQARLWLALALARQGANAKPAAGLVEQELTRANEDTGPALATGLTQMGPAVFEGVVGRFGETIQKGEKHQAFKALTVLGWFGERALSALPVLLQELKAGRDPWFSMSAADAVGAIGPGAKEAVPVLVEIIKNGRRPNAAVHRDLVARAESALKKIEPAAAAALSAEP